MTSVSTPYSGFEYQEFYRRRQQQSSVFLTPSIFSWYQQLLQKYRVYLDTERASWLILGYEEVQHVLSDPLTFSSQRERGDPHIKCQVLLYPVTDATLETLSYREGGAGGYWLTRETMRASLEQLRGLTPALNITCEQDIVRDEGEAYAHQLMAAGVPVRATRYLGAIHDLALLNPIAETPPARAALAQVIDTLRMVFAHRTPTTSGTSPSVEGIESRSSPFAVEATLEHLKAVIGSRNLTLFAQIDHSDLARGIGLTMQEAHVLIFGNPKGGTPLLIASPLLALDLPLKVLVWQSADGQVWVSTNSIAYLSERYALPQELVGPLAVVDAVIKQALTP